MSHKKRKQSDQTEDRTSPSKVKKLSLDVDSALYKDFISYQTELDCRNDKYERLVKLSRDITIHSKRAIFCLLRKKEDSSKSVAEAETKIAEVKVLLKMISEELKGEDPYKYIRSFSPGVQEFVEAISLLCYIKDKRIITYSETLELYFKFESTNVLLTFYDYMYGIADLTGEMMRMAINSVSSREFSVVEEICIVLRKIYTEFSVFNSTQREMSRKVNVMKNSLQKVENACYNLRIRGSEIPEHMLSEIFTNNNEHIDN